MIVQYVAQARSQRDHRRLAARASIQTNLGPSKE